jgi:hypothetical protein
MNQVRPDVYSKAAEEKEKKTYTPSLGKKKKADDACVDDIVLRD